MADGISNPIPHPPLPMLSTMELCAVFLLNGVPTSGYDVAIHTPPRMSKLLVQHR